MNLRKTLSLLIWLLVLAVALYGAGYVYLYYMRLPSLLDEVGRNPATVDFVVSAGESVDSIAARLEQAEVVQSSWALGAYLRREGLDARVQAGQFAFAPGLTVPAVAEALQYGGAVQTKVTLLEGWTSAEMDVYLTEQGLSGENDFHLYVIEGGGTVGNEPDSFVAGRPVASLEGYLFPATYYVDPAGDTAASLVDKMVLEMGKRLVQLGYEPARSERTLHEILTIASIVELEERSSTEQPRVADILWRRYDAGWALGADATLFYTLGHKTELTAADLALDSPYNTRKNIGLPPTPVSNPGESALRAALHPEANEYWYYLHDTQTGQIYYGRTLEEHNANKAKYLR
jgi:UPF0755 protein